VTLFRDTEVPRGSSDAAHVCAVRFGRVTGACLGDGGLCGAASRLAVRVLGLRCRSRRTPDHPENDCGENRDSYRSSHVVHLLSLHRSREARIERRPSISRVDGSAAYRGRWRSRRVVEEQGLRSSCGFDSARRL
jgi:hypothetical protein